MSAPYTPQRTIPGRYDSAAYEDEKVVLAKGCLLLAVTCYNKSGSSVFLIVMDKADATGAWPADNRGGIVEVPAGTVRSLDWSNTPVDMNAGIYVAVSTSDTTKTLPGTGVALFSVAYAFK